MVVLDLFTSSENEAGGFLSNQVLMPGRDDSLYDDTRQRAWLLPAVSDGSCNFF